MTAHALSSTPNSTDGLCAVIEVVNELEEKEKQLPCWNRRGGPKGRGGSEVEMVVFESTTPSLRDTPPVPGGVLLLLPSHLLWPRPQLTRLKLPGRWRLPLRPSSEF